LRVPAIGWLAVGIGAALGAWLRWALGVWLNPLLPPLPLGTVSANLLGGFIIGGVLSAAEPLGFSPALRLLLVTGFLGGLTTFSTFSAETTTLLLQGRISWAAAEIAVHLGGSIAMTTVGVLLVRAWLTHKT
jgi:fluoride exporter